MNHETHERHEKEKADHFRDVTKMFLECNPIEFDGVRRMGR